MTTKETKIALIAEQRANYKDLKSKIDNLINPTERDVNYVQGIMKGKKYTRDNRKELAKRLTEIELKTQVKFETPEPESETQKKAFDTAKKAKKLTIEEVMGTPIAPQTDRAKVFKEVRDELFALAGKCLKYARKSTGGTAMRLAQTSNQLIRLAKTKLRD